MPSDLVGYWLPRMLFRLSILLAAVLALSLLVAPWIVPILNEPPPLLHLFASDVIVQRTGVVCTIGIVVAAFVFFRPQMREQSNPRKSAGVREEKVKESMTEPSSDSVQTS